MAAASPAALARIARSGMGIVTPAAGLAALRATLAGFASANARALPPPELVASPFSWALLLRGRASAIPDMFAEVMQEQPCSAASTACHHFARKWALLLYSTPASFR